MAESSQDASTAASTTSTSPKPAIAVAENASISVCVMDAHENIVETPLRELADGQQKEEVEEGSRRLSTEESVNSLVSKLIGAAAAVGQPNVATTYVETIAPMQSPSRGILTKPYQPLPSLDYDDEDEEGEHRRRGEGVASQAKRAEKDNAEIISKGVAALKEKLKNVQIKPVIYIGDNGNNEKLDEQESIEDNNELFIKETNIDEENLKNKSEDFIMEKNIAKENIILKNIDSENLKKNDNLEIDVTINSKKIIENENGKELEQVTSKLDDQTKENVNNSEKCGYLKNKDNENSIKEIENIINQNEEIVEDFKIQKETNLSQHIEDNTNSSVNIAEKCEDVNILNRENIVSEDESEKKELILKNNTIESNDECNEECNIEEGNKEGNIECNKEGDKEDDGYEIVVAENNKSDVEMEDVSKKRKFDDLIKSVSSKNVAESFRKFRSSTIKKKLPNPIKEKKSKNKKPMSKTTLFINMQLRKSARSPTKKVMSIKKLLRECKKKVIPEAEKKRLKEGKLISVRTINRKNSAKMDLSDIDKTSVTTPLKTVKDAWAKIAVYGVSSAEGKRISKRLTHKQKDNLEAIYDNNDKLDEGS